MPGFFSLRYLPAPETVPPVPTPATKMSTFPPVCALRQDSGFQGLESNDMVLTPAIKIPTFPPVSLRLLAG